MARDAAARSHSSRKKADGSKGVSVATAESSAIMTRSMLDKWDVSTLGNHFTSEQTTIGLVSTNEIPVIRRDPANTDSATSVHSLRTHKTAMGIPVDPSTPSTAQPTPPLSTSRLPPEAIALASKLFDLARTGDTATLSQYLSAGIPPNLTNSKGDTLLMLAAYHGHAATVSALLERRADPNVLNDRGQSPLAGAVFKGYDEVVGVLVEGGADPRLGTPNAVDSARMFKKEAYLELFGVSRDDGEDLPFARP